jgi:vancomycin resistance protein YoaR
MKRWFENKNALLVAIATLAGLIIGFLLVPRAPTPSDDKPPVPELKLLGSPLPLDDKALERALDRVRRYAAAKLVLELPDGKLKSFALGRLGAQIDKLRLTQLVRDARDATSPLRRVWHESGNAGALELPVPIVIDTEQALPGLRLLKDEVDRLPVDARLDLGARKLVPEVDGRQLDIDATLAAIEAAVARGDRRAKVGYLVQKPKRTAAELRDVRFDAVLGWFETRYNRGEKYAARSYNLRLAASKLDGHVLLAGETFDFNEVVGPRDEANGYKVAPVIAEGELVDGIGGGTCQISGTLHGATFFAGLEIVERYPHTRPSGYIKMGLDATVVYPTINFRAKNAFDFPVVLHQTVKNGVVRAEILGPERASTVTLIRRIDLAIPFEQIERPDKELPEGVRVLGQRGLPGFKLHRYRIVRHGAHAFRERWNDVYPPTAQIVRIGTGEGQRDPERHKDDPTPEYVADELLVMTQGIDAEGDEAGTAEGGARILEWREPGAYGEQGWTEKAGMPFWSSEGS